MSGPREIKPGDLKPANTAGLMAGKKGLIMGVANEHSNAWGIADMLSQHCAAMAVP